MERLAIPTLEGKLCAHFGHCEIFSIFDVEDGKVLKQDNIVPPPHEPGLLPKWLKENGVTQIIAGGMGVKAQELFAQNGIGVIVGANMKSPLELVGDFYNGTLKSGENLCDH